MLYKNFFIISFFFLLVNCSSIDLKDKKNKQTINNFTNKGFALVYSDKLYDEKIISNKLNERDLLIFQRNLKKNTQVKITNILNNKSIIAKVGKKSMYPLFNNAVVSIRISKDLNLDIREPYIEITAIPEDFLFVAKKAKIFEEEKKVAIKVPVKGISIDNLNKNAAVKKKNTINKFSYLIKIADFYFYETAQTMTKRIINETSIKNSYIKKLSNKSYRVYLGPFNEINSLQKSYNDIKILGFENIEIIKND
jgi:putative lipase involved disintegration of autophagic bodies